MSRVLIAGCGYVGAATSRLFQAAGWTVEGWTRRGEPEIESGKTWQARAVDLGDGNQVHATEGTFDVVIHSASTRGGDVGAYRRVYLEGARHLRARFGEASFIFVSSSSVYAQRTGEWITEESVAQPEHETGKVLREAEKVVLEHGGTIARLSGLYGPGRSALLQRLLRGEAVVDPSYDRFVNQLHRDDAAAALFLLATKGDAVREQIYNVSDDLPLRLSECYRWLAETLHRSLPRTEEAPPMRKRGNSNKRVSNTKLRQVGWIPTFPSFMDGMGKSVLPESGAL